MTVVRCWGVTLVDSEEMFINGAYRLAQTQRWVMICVSCERKARASGCGRSAPTPPSDWCWAGTRSLKPGTAVRRGSVSIVNIREGKLDLTGTQTCVEQKSHLICCKLRWRFFNSKFSALLCSYFSITIRTVKIYNILIIVRDVRWGHLSLILYSWM